MANLTQTPANVGIGALSTVTRPVTAGEAVTQGMPGYRNDTDGEYYQADANDTEAKAEVVCIFLLPASTDGPTVVALKGLVNLGATLTVGKAYYLSATKGAICPEADLITGDYATFLGIAKTAALLDFQPNPSKTQVP